MFRDLYGKLSVTIWDYLEEQVPNDSELRDRIHDATLEFLDEALREAGVEVN